MKSENEKTSTKHVRKAKKTKKIADECTNASVASSGQPAAFQIADASIKNTSWPLVFDTKMRKTIVKGILQDIKGYIDMCTSGSVDVSYEEFTLGTHEFAFKMNVSKGEQCSNQMFLEASCAIVNAVNYAFPGEVDKYDISICSYGKKVEIEIVSNW